jgi:hypothetical protein
MPNQKQKAMEQVDVEEDIDEELKRPKVGAEMPLGRPSWFRVPAPSQGKSMLMAKLTSLCPAPYIIHTACTSFIYLLYSHNLIMCLHSILCICSC